jgi:ABC-2 type transport system ATP-binding protein
MAMQIPSAAPLLAGDETGAAIVAVQNLMKRYGKFTAVNGVSFSIRPGEIFGLLGPNGAGKTTTLEMIEGIRTPDAGSITVLGMDARTQRRAIQTRIGVQLQATALFPELRVGETIALFGAIYPHARSADNLLREVNLSEKRNAFPQDLSGGQRQRLALALALVNDPAIVFLDEPTTGLDPQSRHQLWDTVLALRAQGKTIVLTTHFMDEAQTLCDRIAIMDHGQIIAEDTPASLISLLGASAAIACAIDPALVPTTLLHTLPAVTDIRDGLDERLLYTDDAEATLLALLPLAARQGAKVERLQIHAPTLEDVFLKLTGRALRE